MNEPYEVRFDDDGNMFFVEMQNHIIRKVDAETGTVSTVAGVGENTTSDRLDVLVRMAEVFAVETETHGARVRYRRQGREHSVVADAAVVAARSRSQSSGVLSISARLAKICR